MAEQFKNQPIEDKNMSEIIEDFFQHPIEQWHNHPLFIAPIPIHVRKSKDKWIAEAELPGVEKEQIRLEIKNQFMRIQVIRREYIEFTDDQKGVTEKQQQSYLQERIIPIPFTEHKEK